MFQQQKDWETRENAFAAFTMGPLTDFWRVGRGTVERLSNMGICTMEEIAHARESL